MPVQSFCYYRGSDPALSRKRGEQMYQLDLHSRAPIYQQLKEKILLFESGLNDAAMELSG